MGVNYDSINTTTEKDGQQKTTNRSPTQTSKKNFIHMHKKGGGPMTAEEIRMNKELLREISKKKKEA